MFCQRCCNLSLPQAHPPATDAASTAASDCSVTESGCGAGQSLGTSDEMSCPAILVTLPDPSCFSDSCLVFFGTFLQIFSSTHRFQQIQSRRPEIDCIPALSSQMEPNLAFLVRAPAVAVPESEAQLAAFLSWLDNKNGVCKARCL